MIITLSPAKILDFESAVPEIAGTKPIYQKEAQELNMELARISVEEITNLMKVNPKLAQQTYEYVHSFEMDKVQQRQAAFVYNGIAYQGLDASTFTAADFQFAQEHLVLMSGMYGILRPLDMIKPHRLDMEIRLKNKRGKNLYDFWKDTLSQHIAQKMSEGSNLWVNLSSKEYEKAIDRKQLPSGHQIVTPVFKEARGSAYKQVVVYAKKARGMMARFIIQNKIEEAEHIKAFDTEGYAYSEQLSTDKEWVFIR